jgi:hypothetical protein
MPFRILASVLGAFFFGQGLQWLTVPAQAAEALGMSLLDGVARSTQIGDMAGFFLCLGGFSLYGAYAQNPWLVRAAGCLVGLSSITRTIAWAFHDAPFATQFIVIEVIAGGALLFAASQINTPTPE